LVEVQVDPEAGKEDRGNFLFLNAETGDIQYRIPPSQRLRLNRESFRMLLMEGLAVQVVLATHIRFYFYMQVMGLWLINRW